MVLTYGSLLSSVTSDTYDDLRILMPLMADAVCILKSSEGPIRLLKNLRSCLQSVSEESNSLEEERAQLNLNFIRSIQRRLLGSRYIFWPAFDSRCVYQRGSSQLCNVMPFHQHWAFPVGRC